MTNDRKKLFNKKVIKENMKTELGTIDVREIEHQISYPGQEEFNLRNVSYTPGENEYLNASRVEDSDDI